MDWQNIDWFSVVLAGALGLAFIGIAVYLLRGFFMVRGNENRAVLEMMGKYWDTVGPGINWRPPILSSIRNWIDIREWSIPIFDKGDIKIDLADGWIKPIDAKVFVRVQDPLFAPQTPPKAIYAVGDWASAINSLAETVTSSYLRSFPLEEVLQGGRGGFDIAEQIQRRSEELAREVQGLEQELQRAKKKDRQEKQQALARFLKTQTDLQKAYDEIQRTEESWGIKVTQIYIPDYELSPKLREARDEVHEAERKARAARHHIEQKALESGGLYGLVKQMLVKDYACEEEEAKQRAHEFVLYFRGTETGSISDIRLQGGDSLAGILAQLFAVWEKMKGAQGGGKTA